MNKIKKNNNIDDNDSSDLDSNTISSESNDDEYDTKNHEKISFPESKTVDHGTKNDNNDLQFNKKIHFSEIKEIMMNSSKETEKKIEEKKEIQNIFETIQKFENTLDKDINDDIQLFNVQYNKIQSNYSIDFEEEFIKSNTKLNSMGIYEN